MPYGTRTLTLRETTEIATLLDWCQHNTKVRWLVESGTIVSGTVRSIGDEQGNFLRADDEVRDAFVRITRESGSEWFAPVAELTRLLRRNEIAEV